MEQWKLLTGFKEIENYMISFLEPRLIFKYATLSKLNNRFAKSNSLYIKLQLFRVNKEVMWNELSYNVFCWVSTNVLIWASFEGHLELVKYLVSLEVYTKADKNRAMKIASEYGRLEVVEYLVSKDANIKAEKNYAVRMASANGHLEVVKYLVSKDANIRADNNYALQSASINGHLDVVKYLFSLSTDIMADKNYILRTASRYHHLEIVNYLKSQ